MAINRNFGRIADGRIEYAKTYLQTDGGVVINPTAEQYAAAGYNGVARGDAPNPPEGEQVVETGYALGEDGLIHTVYVYGPVVHTREEYDAAMEEHLLAERVARGYTTRDPSEYATSSVARFAQDARDWVAHRDAVMVYALGVINAYEETGEAPSLEAFKAALPAIVWTSSAELSL